MSVLMRYASIILTMLLWLLPATAQSAIPQAAAGFNHTLLLKSDGTVWAWGNNTYGQLGNGTTASSNVPVQVVGLKGVTSIAASLDSGYSMTVKSDGTVWSWGSNTYGQLGNGTRISSTVPVQVVGLDSVASVTAGSGQTYALKADGTVWTWGKDLGTPDPLTHYATDGLTPLQASNLSAIASIAASQYATVALKSDGTLWAGRGPTCNPIIGVTAIAMARAPDYVVAVKNDGTVWQCGGFSLYVWGMPLRTFKVDGLAGIRAVAAGDYYGLALKGDGTVSAWGIGTVPATSTVVLLPPQTPADVAGLSGIVSIAAGFDHAVAIKSDGTVWMWGSNTDGQLGNGSNTNASTPVQTFINANAGATGTVVEFYNTNLDNYFITADANEAAAIDGGSAGPGWSRTGNSFKSGGNLPVCRFYGSQSPGPNSHFYTVDVGECNFLKKLQAITPATEKRWNLESLDFVSNE